MGLFKITLTYRSGQPPYDAQTTVVFREFPGSDLDAVWHKLEIKSQEKWGRDLKGFDCVMVSKRSTEYKAFLAKQASQRGQSKLTSVSSPPRGGGHVHPFAQQEMKKNRH